MLEKETDSKEFILQGDIYFKNNNFEQAFAYYHKAHMLCDPNGTYMVAECFRIAFLQANTNNIQYRNHKDYAFKAIECYKIAYRKLKLPKILIRIKFMEYLVGSQYQALQKSRIKSYTDYLNDPFSLFLLATEGGDEKIPLLLSIIEDYDFDKYIKLCVCFEICSTILRIMKYMPKIFIEDFLQEYENDEDVDYVTKIQVYGDTELNKFVELANSLGATLDSGILEHEAKIKRETYEAYAPAPLPIWYYEMHSTPYPSENTESFDLGEFEDNYNYDDGPDDNDDVYGYYHNDDYDS